MLFTPFNPFVPPRQEEPQLVRPAVRYDKKGRPIDPRKEQRRKVMRFLFYPDFSSSFHDLRSTHGMFLRLVCNLFLQTGLIDAAYPGVSNESKLSLRSLIVYAAQNLEFTREGMPRVLMFGAFIGSIGAMVLAILLFALHLMSGPKH